MVNIECITFYKHVGSRQTQTTLLHKWITGGMKYTHFVVSHVCTYCQWNELISSHDYIHRDLAARNVLVGENSHVKISEFAWSTCWKNTLQPSTSLSLPPHWNCHFALHDVPVGGVQVSAHAKVFDLHIAIFTQENISGSKITSSFAN